MIDGLSECLDSVYESVREDLERVAVAMLLYYLGRMCLSVIVGECGNDE